VVDQNSTSDLSEEEEREEEEDDGGKSELPATFLSVLEGINTARRCLTGSDVDCNMVAALSSAGNKLYRTQQKVKKQQLSLMNMWKKGTGLRLKTRIELGYMFKCRTVLF
jgi:hypothetical protein